jgi:hypothetical protein
VNFAEETGHSRLRFEMMTPFPVKVDMAYPNPAQFNHPLNRRRTHWQDWLNVLLAVWLFISPWVLNFGGAVDGGTNALGMVAVAIYAAWNAWVLGVIIFLLSLSGWEHRRA